MIVHIDQNGKRIVPAACGFMPFSCGAAVAYTEAAVTDCLALIGDSQRIPSPFAAGAGGIDSHAGDSLRPANLTVNGGGHFRLLEAMLPTPVSRNLSSPP